MHGAPEHIGVSVAVHFRREYEEMEREKECCWHRPTDRPTGIKALFFVLVFQGHRWLRACVRACACVWLPHLAQHREERREGGYFGAAAWLLLSVPRTAFTHMCLDGMMSCSSIVVACAAAAAARHTAAPQQQQQQ